MKSNTSKLQAIESEEIDLKGIKAGLEAIYPDPFDDPCCTVCGLLGTPEKIS
ncbi:hypothetical protein AB9P05_22790 [Roseivirga sp. BDSF3-8]|uniref:hypothetical protein n=1 Tax=Roseivirga sp. BDSF3-8 TaxID=3241598 RepID=UPI003531BA08